jgi:hypothetical protein
MVTSSAGLGTKNDCAGENQQQFTLPTTSKHGNVEQNSMTRYTFDKSRLDNITCIYIVSSQ